MKVKKAFTLAELLVTIAIIGIVASLVIPNLLNSSNQKEYQSALKKSYGALSNATRTIMLNNSGSMTGLCSSAFNASGTLIDPDTANNCISTLYQQQFNVTKTCDTSNFLTQDSVEGCWPAVASLFDGSAAYAAPTTNSAGFISTDGVSYGFQYSSKNCNDATYSTTASPPSAPACGRIDVDVNGFKGPNVIGKDQYIFRIASDRIYPMGVTGDKYTGKAIGLTAAIVTNASDTIAASAACHFNGDGTFICD